jgi:hypothetical protein
MSAQLATVEQSFTAGKEIVDRLKTWGSGWMTSLRRLGPSQQPVTAAALPPASLQQANQTVAVSCLSAGLTVAGWALAQPALNLVGIPLALYVFVPTFRGAYHTLRKERRIDNQVLDATRVALCVVLRYDAITAMNALLQSGSQRFFAQSEATFQRGIEALPWRDGATSHAVRRALSDAVAEKSAAQEGGEASARRMAPWMLVSFVLSWPLLGVNRAAAFLTTGFGWHLRTLGPLTVRNTLLAAAEEGIVIKDLRGLEAAAQIDTLVIHASVLADAAARDSAQSAISALRDRVRNQDEPCDFTAYLLGDEAALDELCPLAAAWGFDACVAAFPTTVGRAICYVGLGGEDDRVHMAQSTLAVAWRTSNALSHEEAHVVLLDGDLTALARLADRADAYADTQRFNFRAPIGFDIVDLGTTIFMHLGLSYSVLFNFAGLFTAAASVGRQQKTNARVAEQHPDKAKETLTVAPMPLVG